MSDNAKKQNIPELLSPAGSIAALRAAIDGGADAVYFAMPEFNARINADNFTPESFAEGVELCHLSGVRAYITLNTQIYDRERADFLRTAEKAYLSGVDAAIVGDLGAARLLHKYIPELELHASTQLSGHSTDGGRALAELGFTRMVCAREMSLADIRKFTEDAPLEAEIFIHGALCVCHSGQCLFSSMVGGRSGNRGLCAQPCRLPYKTAGKRESYPLSLKDMSLADHIPEIIDSGVASLKIEGRMKPADYVYRVTSIYRTLLDEGRAANVEERRELADAFSRGGSFTDAYFTDKARGTKGTGMLGVRSEVDKGRSRESAVTKKDERRARVSLSAEIQRDTPMKLTLTLCEDELRRFRGVTDPSVTVSGDIPFEAVSRPTDSNSVLLSLSKLGGTPFVSEGGSLKFDDGLMIPHSSLNALRRAAVEELKGRVLEPYSRRSSFKLPDISELSAPIPKRVPENVTRTAIFYDPAQMSHGAACFFDLVYLPLTAFERLTENEIKRHPRVGVMMPPVVFDSEIKKAESLLLRAKALGVRDVLVENLGQLALADTAGMKKHGGMRLGAANTDGARVLREFFVEDVILSPELTLPRLRDISAAVSGCGAIVYGRIPLMITEKCLIREISTCEECNKRGGTVTLTDRTGANFPVRREFGHRSLIFNSLPTYTADLGAKMPAMDGHVFLFADENAGEVDSVIDAYKRGLPPAKKVRRI